MQKQLRDAYVEFSESVGMLFGCLSIPHVVPCRVRAMSACLFLDRMTDRTDVVSPVTSTSTDAIVDTVVACKCL